MQINKKISIHLSDVSVDILNHSFEGVVITKSSHDSSIVYVNPAWEKVTGWSGAEVIGKHSPNVLKSGKQDAEFYKKMWQTILQGGLFSAEIVNKRKDGTLYNADINIFSVKDDTGNVFYVEFSRDITYRKKYEQEIASRAGILKKEIERQTKELGIKIKESEDARDALLNVIEDIESEKSYIAREKIRFEETLKSIGDGVIAVDIDGIVFNINARAKSIIGASDFDEQKEHISYLDLFSLIDDKGAVIADEKRPLSVVLKTGTGVIVKNVYFEGKNKKRIPVNITASPIIIDGKIAGAVKVFRDITEEKKLEKIRLDFLSLASHQLRTPLSGTKWLIETLKKEKIGPLNKKQSQYLDNLYETNERMIKLVFDMLNTIRLESGNIVLEKENILLSDILEKAKSEANIVADVNNVSLRIEPDHHYAITVATDVKILENILDCFISNAISYSHKGGEVVIDAKYDEKFVTFSVKDFGIGIPKNEQNRIFERFYRASNAIAEKPSGTGLGLYISKILANYLKGEISVVSDEGKGSTFSLRIPRT